MVIFLVNSEHSGALISIGKPIKMSSFIFKVLLKILVKFPLPKVEITDHKNRKLGTDNC